MLLTEDGRILDLSMKVVKGYVVEDKTLEAWGLFPDLLVPDRETGKPCLIISERDLTPMALGKARVKHTIATAQIEKIAEQSADADIAKQEAKSFKNKIADALGTIAIIFAITVCIIVIFGLISTGKLHLPGVGGVKI